MKTKSKRKNNVQLVSHIMNYSDHGALAQIFVMNALATSAEAVIAAGVESMPKNSWVNPEAWISVAEEILAKMKENAA